MTQVTTTTRRYRVTHRCRMVTRVSTQTIRLSRRDLEEILHYAHWIAAKSGAQRKLMAKYPGYSFAGLMRTLIDHKCLAQSRSRDGELAHFSGYRVRQRVEFVDIPVNELPARANVDGASSETKDTRQQ